MSERYDPQAVDDTPGRSEYFSRKDAKWFVLLFVIAAAAGYPLFQWGNDQKNKALCSNNIKALGDALNLYAEQNDDRYPPLFEADSSGAPDTSGGKIPVTWASVVRSYHNGRTDLRCPAADEDEHALTQWRGGPTPITYGLYAAHSTVTRTNIGSPDETILLAETSNLGSKGSFDPLPYKDASGNRLSDAFVIGWDNSNEAPNAQTKAVTRLAFRETGNGAFGEKSYSRHSPRIHAITVSGRRVLLSPQDSRATWRITTLTGQWRSQP